MYVDICKFKQNGRYYKRALIREGYREEGKVKHRTIANISHCSEVEIEAIRLALKHKKNISYIENLAHGKHTNGKIIGVVFSLYQVCRALGITKVLGRVQEGLFILWLVLARLIDQGSRLSAVRLAQIHAGCETIGIKSMKEDDLYAAMDWFYEKRMVIEQRLFRQWEQTKSGKKSNHIFLYDVTSSYLEGKQNELADWGYNRDKKRGKKQIVYGLLTDESGEPLSLEAFKGNTKDNKTLSLQVEKLKKRFNCKYITLVGDKGMIKSSEIEALHDVGFNFITSITKPQIKTLLEDGFLEMSLFDENLFEIEDIEKGLRYIIRRNPHRAKEMAETRKSKIASISKKISISNKYLSEHPRAKVSLQKRDLKKYVEKLKMGNYIKISKVRNSRRLKLEIDDDNLAEESKLDGCYVIKTDLPQDVASKEIIHSRYKSLSKVEFAFRSQKSDLDVRPFYVRKRSRTISHLFIVMLAYKIERYLREAWSDLDITVSEGIETLSKISTSIIKIGKEELIRIPEPDEKCKELLKRINVTLPQMLPKCEVHVVTRKKISK